MKLVNINGNMYEVDDNYNKYCFEVLLKCLNKKERVVLDYGDPVTKKSWGETSNVCGRIGRSTGSIKVLILLPNSRSTGGCAILIGHILSIKTSKGKKVLWSL